MITGIQLRNFKAHAELEIRDIPHLAVLVGRNNTGKSSVMQAALIPKYGWYQDAPLPIGHSLEVPHKKGEEVRVLLSFRGVSFPMLISINKGGGVGTQWQGPQPERSPQNDVHYLSAQRTAYRQFGYNPFATDVGMTGEQTWNILHQLKADSDPRFEKIVEWLRKMDLGISMVTTPTVQPGQGAIVPVSYGDRINVIMQGSGTWTLLPIITQGLLAESGHTIMIEEPESHLHRAAINDLWMFFADCAKRDVQVICTTHSLDFLAAMSERMERGEVPKESAIFHLKRDELGKTSASSLDPSVFRNVVKVIKDDLAATYPLVLAGRPRTWKISRDGLRVYSARVAEKSRLGSAALHVGSSSESAKGSVMPRRCGDGNHEERDETDDEDAATSDRLLRRCIDQGSSPL